MENKSSIQGHVALVTAGAVGIGEATAERLAYEGARVALLDLDEAKGEDAARRIQAEGGEARFINTDATSSNEIKAAVETALHAWGRIDILVNCAGGFVENPAIEDLDEAQWRRVVDLNLKSVFLCSRAVMPFMKKARYGRIVNIASQAGRDAVAETGLAYGAAKAGLFGFCRRLSVEAAPHGVTVNTVAPGVVLTPRTAVVHKDRIPEIVAKIPVGRVADAADIADAVWFLARPEARYVTGVTLDVNGGRYVH
ncbi:MAG: SDR family oxidoreductase [Nitrospinae bacterium]|nr:SDR family oxidoreductase [Nitrospinota bacterium]